MGLLQFGMFVILTLAITALILWVADKLSPGHPKMFDNAMWVLAALIVVWALAGALGLHDVQIPRVFSR